jgi:hypothetical protein
MNVLCKASCDSEEAGQYAAMAVTQAQPDLFAAAPQAEEPYRVTEADRAPVRRDLYALLEKAQKAERLPWDYTQAALAEMRVDSMSKWLPDDEAASLRQRFAEELDRLYALEPQPDA